MSTRDELKAWIETKILCEKAGLTPAAEACNWQARYLADFLVLEQAKLDKKAMITALNDLRR